MKNLKQAYKLLYLIPLAFLVGCFTATELEDVITVSSTNEQSTVFIETDDTHETSRVVPANVPQPIEVGVNNALASDLSVSFNVTKNGGNAVEGTDYMVEDAIIYSSDYFGSTQITFMTSGIYEVTVGSSSDSSLVVVDNKAIFSVPPPVIVTITWDNAFYDYDLYHIEGNQDINGAVLANTFDTIAFEQFEIYPPEGFSSIFIDDWWGDNASIPVDMTVEVEGVISNYNVIMDMDKFVLLIETSIGGDGFPVYEFTDLN